MKKTILGMLTTLMLLILAGCTSSEKLNLEEIATKIDALTGEKIDIQNIYPEDSNVYGELEFIYDFDFEEKLGLDENLVQEQYKAFYNEETKELLLVLIPEEGKIEEVKAQLNELANKVNATITEKDGLLIYVASNDNEKVLNTIYEAKAPIFGAMQEVQKEDLETTIGVSADDIDEILMKMPMMMIDSSTYIIVKAKNGKENNVKEAFDTYMQNLEEQWSMYLPDQYELVKNRTVTKVGDYLVYIVSKDNDAVLNAIKG